MKRDNCSVDRLREALDYNSETGVILWRIGQRKGMIAGCVNVSGGIAYRAIMFEGVTRRAHRIAWAIHHGRWPELEIDHRNGDGLDNRIDNLRESDTFSNARNRRIASNNKSGVCGVHFSEADKKWVAQIAEGGKRVCIGRFDIFDDAVKARRKREEKLGYSDQHGMRGRQCNYVPRKRGSVADEGVRYSSSDGKWNARCTINGERVFVGMFDSKEDALEARKAVQSGAVNQDHYRQRIHKKKEVADVD